LDRGRLFRLASLLLLLICTSGALAQASANHRKAAALLGFAVGPILLVFLYSRSGAQPIFLIRAFIASSAIIPLMLAACVAYQSGRRKILFTALLAVLIAATGISLLGFFEHFQNEDWRGATTRLLSLPPERRLVVFVTNAGQVLFHYYASRSPDPAARPEETGLPEGYNYRDPVFRGLSGFNRVTALQPLRQAVDSGKFTEIDVVISHSPPILDQLARTYLLPKYAQISDEDFYKINIVRWKLRATP
jgi:hypothetical protein